LDDVEAHIRADASKMGDAKAVRVGLELIIRLETVDREKHNGRGEKRKHLSS